MRERNLRRTLVTAGLIATSTVLVLVLAVAGLLAFIVTSTGVGSSWNASIDELFVTLMRIEGGYALANRECLAGRELQAILMDEDDAMMWQQGKPADVPGRHPLTGVATFTRWYLNGYSVQVRVRGDGLPVADGPKRSTWKHPFVLDMDVLKAIFFWFVGLFLLALLGVLGPITLILNRQFRREQQEQGSAHSDWVNDIPHDIRTPLSAVMGYVGQLGVNPVLPPRRKTQAIITHRQNQIIRDLVNDLNLTIRLDYAMQPLRRENLHPTTLVRQVAADILSGRLEERYILTVKVSLEIEVLTLERGASLLRRALLNLMSSRMRHNPEGCSIILATVAGREVCTLRVEDDGGGGLPGAPVRSGLVPDGGAAHGTDSGLMRQITRAHGDTLEPHQAVRGVLAVFHLPLWAHRAPGHQRRPGVLHEKGEVWEESTAVRAV